MGLPKQSLMRNKLLALLPEPDYAQLAAEFEHVDLPRGLKLTSAGGFIDHVYFPASGIASVVVTTPDGHRAEAGLFGFDGFVPTSAAAGVALSAHDVSVQVQGEGYRIDSARFCQWMEQNRNFARLLARSTEAFSVQVAYTAISNAIHGVNQRLARWLLMCHDRVSGHELALTHEFIALMLAVRRPSVTTSLHMLEGNGLIRADRAMITIRNRSGLEEFAKDAYGRPEEAYRRLMTGVF